MTKPVYIMGNRLLVREIKEEKQQKGTLILIKEDETDLIKCEVLGVGLKDKDEKGYDSMECMEVGNIVYIRRYTYVEAKLNGEDCMIVPVHEVYAVEE